MLLFVSTTRNTGIIIKQIIKLNKRSDRETISF